jgi:TPR repeat protein
MKKLALSALIAALITAGGNVFASADQVKEQREEVRMRSMLYSADYDSMMALVQKQQFAKAFPEIMRFARYGEKYAQYLAGLLMVTGQDVPANVEEGLVWMKLSLEQDTTDWKRRYDDIIKNLTKEQLDSLNPMYEEFKQRYGAENQFMRCGYERLRGSNLRQHTCRKNLLMNEYYTVVEYKEVN